MVSLVLKFKWYAIFSKVTGKNRLLPIQLCKFVRIRNYPNPVLFIEHNMVSSARVTGMF